MSVQEKSLKVPLSKVRNMIVAQARSKIITQVISGGQTGADIAGLKAADQYGIHTGGVAPRDYRTELGVQKNLLTYYGLREHPIDSGYKSRTLLNIADSDMTLILGIVTGGTKLTVELCLRLGKPRHHISFDHLKQEDEVEKTFNRILSVRRSTGRALIVNIAGNSESKSPGIEYAAEEFLLQVFKKVKDAEAS